MSRSTEAGVCAYACVCVSIGGDRDRGRENTSLARKYLQKMPVEK